MNVPAVVSRDRTPPLGSGVSRDREWQHGRKHDCNVRRSFICLAIDLFRFDAQNVHLPHHVQECSFDRETARLCPTAIHKFNRECL